MPYLTPETLPTSTVCRVLQIPNDPAFVAAVSGAIAELRHAYNWELHGAVTPEDAAEASRILLEEYFGSDCMIGMVGYWAGILPDNVLRCDGGQHPRVDYPLLYDQLHSTYIVDADNFVTPDITGRFIYGGTASTQGDTGGKNQVQLTVNDIPSHTHAILPHTHSEVAAVAAIINGGLEAPAAAAVPAPSVTGPTSLATEVRGGDGSHENRPRYIRLTPGIIAK